MIRLFIFIFFYCFVHSATAQVVVGYWKGVVTHQNKKWELGVEIKHQSDSLRAIVNFLDIAVWDVPFSIKLNGRDIYLSRPQPNGKAIVFEGTVDNEQMQGKFTGVGIAGAPFVLRKQAPASYVKEEIEIINDTVTISGTLITPTSKGRYPLVIFIHGGSPDLRRVYAGPAMEFVQHGFAAFIYDKRGVGKSKRGHWQTDGIEALASDVVASVQQLKTHARIDKTDITVYGHSEGGWTAPTAATMCGDIKHIIISGASGVSASEQTLYTRRKVMEQEGFPDSVVDRALDLWRQLYAATKLCYTDTIRARTLNSALHEKINLVHDEPWFRSSALPYLYSPDCPTRGFLDLLFKDPLDIWAKIKIPVLGVWGREDIVVPVDTSIHLLKRTLSNSGNNQFTSIVLPGLDHSGNIIAQSGEWDFPRSSKAFTSQMISWLNNNKTK